jgi:hypothetical protein
LESVYKFSRSWADVLTFYFLLFGVAMRFRVMDRTKEQRHILCKSRKKHDQDPFSLTASVAYWSEILATDPEFRVRFSAPSDFLRSSGSGTGSTQPREYN